MRFLGALNKACIVAKRDKPPDAPNPARSIGSEISRSITILQTAISAVPAVKYALGIAGVAAAAAIIMPIGEQLLSPPC